MIDVVAVSCDILNNIYYLSPNGLDLKKGDSVIFETDNGLLVGKVCKEVYQEKSNNLVLPLNKVLRLSSKDDMKKNEKNIHQAEKALNDAKKISKELN